MTDRRDCRSIRSLYVLRNGQNKGRHRGFHGQCISHELFMNNLLTYLLQKDSHTTKESGRSLVRALRTKYQDVWGVTV